MIRAILMLSLLAVHCQGVAQSESRVVKPEIRKGDRWTYRSVNLPGPGTHEIENQVTFSDGKSILVVSSFKGGDREIDTSWTAEWNAVKPLGEIVFRPDSGVFRFPLRVGDRYDVSYELLRPQRSEVDSTTTGTVAIVGWEEVEVPAGRFRALRLEMDTLVRPTGRPKGFQRKLTYWYVPDVRRWVKSRITTPQLDASEELLFYKLNDD
jgi:hypothetical protein